jgi:hypothetical protein
LNGRGNGFAENDADSGSSGDFSSVCDSDEHQRCSGAAHNKQNCSKQRNHSTGGMGFSSGPTGVVVIVCRIADRSSRNHKLRFHSSRLMTWYPNFVLTAGEVCPFWSEKAAVSNSLTIFPRVNVPRSPPFFPDGHCETSLAMFENFSPLFKRSNTVLASCSVLTRIWAQ